jgi:hypothetical protein
VIARPPPVSEARGHGVCPAWRSGSSVEVPSQPPPALRSAGELGSTAKLRYVVGSTRRHAVRCRPLGGSRARAIRYNDVFSTQYPQAWLSAIARPLSSSRPRIVASEVTHGAAATLTTLGYVVAPGRCHRVHARPADSRLTMSRCRLAGIPRRLFVTLASRVVVEIESRAFSQ